MTKNKNKNISSKMTVYFSDEISIALDKVAKDNKKIGERKHSIVLKCIARGLKEIYGIEV